MAVSTETTPWTLEQLDRLPDDGNTYELVHGELFVTPAPTPDHEEILARLHQILTPYVEANGLGRVYRPHAVIQLADSQVEPDLMVRRPGARGAGWRELSVPILVVEVLSPTTAHRDQRAKRQLYLEIGVAEYWMIDPERSSIRVVRAGTPDLVTSTEYIWRPSGAEHGLAINVAALFV